MFAFSSLFTGSMISAAFDAAIQSDAANGRVSSQFSQALASAYGLEIPASPRAAVGFINQFVGADKAPTIGKGPGARVGARAVAQALHALAQALHASGAVKNLPVLAPLPAWADPAALAEKAAERAAARAAKPAVTQDTAPDTVPAAKAAREALALVQAALAHGVFSASECDALAALAATCQRAPEKATKATKAAKATKATKATKWAKHVAAQAEKDSVAFVAHMTKTAKTA